MLRPSRPMMRPFRSSLGRSTTETVVSMACSAPQRWIASVMYCLARSTAVSRASASSRLSSFAESCRASLSICLISSSLASSAVRLATRSSSCCCAATSCSYFAAAAAADFSRSWRALSRAASSFSSRSIAVWRSATDASRRVSVCSSAAACWRSWRACRSASMSSSCAFSLASSSDSFLRVSASRSASLTMRAPRFRRGRSSRRQCASGWRSTRHTRRRPPPRRRGP